MAKQSVGLGRGNLPMDAGSTGGDSTGLKDAVPSAVDLRVQSEKRPHHYANELAKEFFKHLHGYKACTFDFELCTLSENDVENVYGTFRQKVRGVCNLCKAVFTSTL